MPRGSPVRKINPMVAASNATHGHGEAPTGSPAVPSPLTGPVPALLTW